jgi:methylated-DNA-protein-cysteine methyltransferase related protein
LSINNYAEDIYDVIRTIPLGRVSTYGAIADFLALGSARMVGWALRNLSSIHADVPAHRVVNRIGELSGRNHFSDPGLMAALLISEGIEVKNDKIVGFNKFFWHPRDGVEELRN